MDGHSNRGMKTRAVTSCKAQKRINKSTKAMYKNDPSGFPKHSVTLERNEKERMAWKHLGLILLIKNFKLNNIILTEGECIDVRYPQYGSE